VVPSPNWPWPLAPQVQTVPSLLRATLKALPVRSMGAAIFLLTPPVTRA